MKTHAEAPLAALGHGAVAHLGTRGVCASAVSLSLPLKVAMQNSCIPGHTHHHLASSVTPPLVHPSQVSELCVSMHVSQSISFKHGDKRK